MKRKGKNDFVYTCVWMNDLGEMNKLFVKLKAIHFPPKYTYYI